jgi:TetR/AcrR family transcriptional repressor of lmrAB and yxaGH operons
MNAADTTVSTRDRLIAAMLDALRRRGYHGVGLAELLASAGAPKGVLYHHFPGGKAELAVAAVQVAIEAMLASLDKLFARHAHPADALAAWMEGAQKQLVSSDFERGCPLATIALESAPEDAAIRDALAAGFAAIRERLAAALVRHGASAEIAGQIAMLIVSAYEGALLQARVAGRLDAMAGSSAALVALVRAHTRSPA